MNKNLSNYARQQLKEGLPKCTDKQQLLFKRMYSHNNLERAIEAVVDGMPDNELDWALSQVERTLKSNSEEVKE